MHRGERDACIQIQSQCSIGRNLEEWGDSCLTNRLGKFFFFFFFLEDFVRGKFLSRIVYAL